MHSLRVNSVLTATLQNSTVSDQSGGGVSEGVSVVNVDSVGVAQKWFHKEVDLVVFYILIIPKNDLILQVTVGWKIN